MLESLQMHRITYLLFADLFRCCSYVVVCHWCACYCNSAARYVQFKVWHELSSLKITPNSHWQSCIQREATLQGWNWQCLNCKPALAPPTSGHPFPRRAEGDQFTGMQTDGIHTEDHHYLKSRSVGTDWLIGGSYLMDCVTNSSVNFSCTNAK